MRGTMIAILLLMLGCGGLPMAPAVDQATVDRVLADEPAKPAPPKPAPELEGMTFTANAAVMQLAPRPDKRLLAFGDEACPLCIADKPLLIAGVEAAGLSHGINDGDDVQLIDCTTYPDLQSKYGVTKIPQYIVVDAAGAVQRSATGLGTWKSLLSDLRPKDVTRAAGQSLGTLSGASSKIRSVIDTLRPLLGDGGKLAITYTGPASPEIGVSGINITFANPTTLTWTFTDDVLRCEFNPSPTAKVKGFPVKFRGLKLTPEKIVVDIPWLPDAVIEVR